MNDDGYPEPSVGVVKTADSDLDSSDCYTLRVYPARGGRVIQYYRYDRQNDRSKTSLYVIADSEDLGDAVKNIVVEQSLQGY
jgi:hypothetical protein